MFERSKCARRSLAIDVRRLHRLVEIADIAPHMIVPVRVVEITWQQAR
jgi:hypothetical protein